jgi:long-chain acyl-CoA synthetase
LAFQKEGAARWSYADLAERVGRLAAGLAGAGLGRGDRVALLAGTRPEWIAACLAVIRAGAVAVPLDVQLGDGMLRHTLEDSGARLLFTTADQLTRLGRLGAPGQLRIVLLDAGDEDERGWGRLLAEEVGEIPPFAPGDPAVLFYTSGTTGPPKGVPLSHGNLAFQVESLLEARLVREDDRVLLPLPLHHAYPFLLGVLAPLAYRLAIVLPRSLTGPQIARALREGEASILVGVPRLYRALYEGLLSRADADGRLAGLVARGGVALSTCLRRRLGLRLGKVLLRSLHRQLGPRLRLVISGGAALDPELAWRLEGIGWQVSTGYGLTETAPMLTLDPPGRVRPGSAGRTLPGVEIRIDGPAGQGEIQARGPGIFAGYHNLPHKTAEAFTPDGWFRTGDLGHFDSDGYLYIDGRAATLIVTEGGEKVQPEQVEEAYQESPILREVGVLQHEGRLVALIVPDVEEVRRRGEEVAPAVRAAVAERSRGLASYQRIGDYTLTRQALPRTHLGKIRRHELAERYRQARQGGPARGGPLTPEEMSDDDRALLDELAARRVWDWLAGRFPGRALSPDTSLRLDLGIDSLEWLNLTLELARHTGLELGEEAVARVETVRDLLREAVAPREAGELHTLADVLRSPEDVLSDWQKRWLEPPGPVTQELGRWLAGALGGLMRGLFHLRVEGVERLPRGGPYLLAPNHASYLDAPALAAALGDRRLRQTYWAGWTGVMFNHALARAVSRLARVVPIDPDRAVLSSLALGACALKRGCSLVWFPEGERTRTGEMRPFRPGVGLLLAHFRVPVVPVFLHGTYEALPRSRSLPRLRPIRVVFGEPLDPVELERQGRGEHAHERIAQALHDRVAELGRRG